MLIEINNGKCIYKRFELYHFTYKIHNNRNNLVQKVYIKANNSSCLSISFRNFDLKIHSKTYFQVCIITYNKY